MPSKVLLVEDEKLAAKYFKRALESHNIEVDYYESLEELREHYGDLNQYKMVFVDLRLDKNGWHIGGKDVLKEMLDVSDMPFYVIWTAYGECPEARECLNIGASLIMSKDGNSDKILELAGHIDKTYEPRRVYGY